MSFVHEHREGHVENIRAFSKETKIRGLYKLVRDRFVLRVSKIDIIFLEEA